ncbi:zinc-finger domain-containing protein [Paenibacillus apii]|uniref:zinc-finger domain-containing protein n=1 Tax=Paenibacillus apii TaxID=1850370 RepID=UPI00143AA3BF|nr:zinc-finger domain-containing protein [Paenibacillus apii]NJJ37851.1 zinc-finger domain-containing protein [Paenibacillus apii]
MNRSDAIKKIVHSLDTKCGPCEVKEDRGRGTGKAMNAAQFQQHCIHNCPVSLEMQDLSRYLGGPVRRRRNGEGRKQA